MDPISLTLSGIAVGRPLTSGALTMFPLLNGKNGQPDYLTLDEALTQGLATITEISESGTVPELKFVNRAERPVLLVDGEELVGAKQNRILNLTILVPARRELRIPVSCVERGRWGYKSHNFTSAPRTQFASSRARKTSSVSSSLKTGQRDADQGQTWSEVDALLCHLDVQSPTSAMSDAFENHANRLDDQVRELQAVEGQAGAVFAVNEQIVGLDLFDHGSTFGKLLPKLIRSYAVESLGAVRNNGQPEVRIDPAVRHFLNSIQEANAEHYDAIGEGEDIRINDTELSAAALVARGRLIHLCGFPTSKNGSSEPSMD